MSDNPEDTPEFAKYAASPVPLGQILAHGSLSPAQSLIDFNRELETWAVMNKEDAHNDAIKFWALKVPAIVVSASAGLFASLNSKIAIIAGGVGSACVLVDGLLRAGMLRNVHIRAFHDLRSLQSDLVRRWQIGCYRGRGEEELAAEVLQYAMKEREAIEAYLKAAESSRSETQAK